MDYKLEFVNCNICGEDNTDKISEKGQFNLPLVVNLCKNCGLGYLNPRWDESGYLDFYKNQYDKFYRPHLKEDSSKRIDNNNPIIERFKLLENTPEKVNTILEIGSGAGENIKAFGDFFSNSNLYAIEPSVDSQKHLLANNINILSNDANSNWDIEFSGKFDIIIMRHVLEHFLDPVKILNKINNALSDNGLLYIAVPNNLNPTSNLEKNWFRVVHTYYFNKHSLKNILSKSKFDDLVITEGDQYNKGEVFLFAKKNKSEKSLNLSNSHYEIQKKVFSKILRNQKKPLYQIKFKLKNLINKFS